MRADAEGMERLGLEPDSIIGVRVAECCFDVYERDDGMKPEGPDGSYDPNGAEKYNKYLKAKGYDSDNPFLPRRGMEFIENATAPWCCHLSYIKPHWPYIVPEPYHKMYGPEHVQEPVRSDAEYENAHPVLRAFMDSQIGKAFSQKKIRDAVIPAYMGLIKQCDDQMGVLCNWLEETGRMDDTMIVLTSDYGDFLGDHWMGEKTFSTTHQPKFR